MDINNWYWQVAGNANVFSSASGTYVPTTDTAYQTWVSGGHKATPAPTEGELIEYLTERAPNIVVLTPAGLAAYAASVRYSKEVGGTSISGVNYATDRTTQAKLTSAYALGQLNPAATFQWKLPEGTFVTLNVTQLQTVAQTIGAFVQGCFATEQSVDAQIVAGTITTKAQVDAAFA